MYQVNNITDVNHVVWTYIDEYDKNIIQVIKDFIVNRYREGNTAEVIDAARMLWRRMVRSQEYASPETIELFLMNIISD